VLTGWFLFVCFRDSKSRARANVVVAFIGQIMIVSGGVELAGATLVASTLLEFLDFENLSSQTMISTSFSLFVFHRRARLIRFVHIKTLSLTHNSRQCAVEQTGVADARTDQSALCGVV
jgi:hypothetical protein